MEKLFETHKNLVWGAIIVLSILLCLNVINDTSFRVFDISNPLIVIALIAAVVAFFIGMVSGYSSSENGAHGTEETASTTTDFIGSFALALGIMLAANFLGGHEALNIAMFCIGGIAVIIILVMLSPLGGPSSHQAGNRHDRSVIRAHGGTRAELEVDETEVTDDNKSSKKNWVIGGIVLFLIIVVLSHNSRNNDSPVTMHQNQNNGSGQSSQASNQVNTVVDGVDPNAEAGSGVKP